MNRFLYMLDRIKFNDAHCSKPLCIFCEYFPLCEEEMTIEDTMHKIQRERLEAKKNG